ncbi:Permease, cytosine/purine, uracil, thiamine, allantoin family protein [Ceratobasidium theobromae]|uniref:Permease, cytosine/purine, uracil, thiamine, allantoin family protein n=1 Tax=Ceratobasidium theobromae TaxID=1582974 RepID=A0A5N5QB73_9AGAM|nr:Permease, cytosine/purine, uracil, thiamine, allantoin family protein [Ceratobasidium theobromae]
MEDLFSLDSVGLHILLAFRRVQRTYVEHGYALRLSDVHKLGQLITQNSIINVGSWFILEAGIACNRYRPVPRVYFLSAAEVDCYERLQANGTIGAKLHIPFPVLNRSSFGFWLSYFSVVSRVVLAMFWFAIQTYTGSECVYQMLKAIWPSIAHIPNHLPESANITTAGIMCYFLYWLIQLPFLLVSPHKIRYLFIAKAILAPTAGLSMMIWAFARTGGGPIFAQKATVSGSALSWAMLSAMNSAIGNYATLSVNIPDFTRYARSPRDQYIQILIIPVIFTFFAFMGIAVTSAGNVIYGEILWDPLTLIDRWDNRAAAFFASFAFCLATIGTNVSANSISAANDFTALLPKVKNRSYSGNRLLTVDLDHRSAIGFLNFMGGYTVFLGPICSIMIVDYWLVHRGKIDVPALYDPKGRYKYTAGVNWRALLALLVAVPPNLPGLIHSINPNIRVGMGAQHLFSIAWLLGFSLAGATYFIASKIFPPVDSMVDELITGDDHNGVQHNSSDHTNDEKSSDVKVLH